MLRQTLKESGIKMKNFRMREDLICRTEKISNTNNGRMSVGK